VAERAAAPPGSMSLLSVAVQLFGTPNVVSTVPAGSFWPVPKVSSAILAITDITRPADAPAILRLARAGFSQKRKQLSKTLSQALRCDRPLIEQALTAQGLPPTARPQELSVADWRVLARTLSSTVA